MNYLWGGMIAAGIVYAALTGTLPDVTQAAIDSSKEAVTLCITMLGIMAMWTGLMNIAEEAGIISGATKLIKPVLRFLFPNIPSEHVANRYIAENCIANVFGLGWAATPAGLKAMKALKELEKERIEDSDSHDLERPKQSRIFHRKRKTNLNEGTANDEMCTFLILNISSLQLIPVNMIAYRSQYGSVNPAGIIAPAMLATLCSTLAAVVFCKIRTWGK